MQQALFVLVVGILACWIYWDASGHKIGKVKTEKGFFNISAGAWGIASFFFTIFTVPLYFIKRNDLIQKGIKNPVNVTGRRVKAIGLLLLAVTWSIGLFLTAKPVHVSQCDASATQKILEEIINKHPIYKSEGIRYITTNNIIENGFNEESQLRYCSGGLVTTAGSLPVEYVVKWVNPQKRFFTLEVYFPE